MKIIVEDLPLEGTAISANLGTGWALQSARQALEGEPLRLQVDLLATQERGTGARVQGEMEAQVARHCDRCMAPVLLTLEGPVDLLYLPQESGTPGEHRLSPDELDVGWFAGGTLDMEDVLIEQLALWMPERVRCDNPGVTRQEEGPCEAAPIADAAPADADPGPGRTFPFANLKLPASPKK